MIDHPGYWGAIIPTGIVCGVAGSFLFSDVASAYEAMASRQGRKSGAGMTGYAIRDFKGVPLELWLFLDVGLPHGIGLHFVRGGSLAAPSVAMTALCSDGEAICESRMSVLLNGPAFAREHYADRTLSGPGDGTKGNRGR